MTVSMISFFISAIAIIIMISLKSYEMKTNKKLWLSSLAEKTDHKVSSVYVFTRRIISYINRHSAIALMQWIAYHILSWIRGTYISMRSVAHSYPHSKKVLDMVRGRGVAVKNNGASFYLKRIGEEKS